MKKIKINGESEYNALREEILKRIGLGVQILNLNLTIVAAFFGFGITNSLIILCLPIVTLLLAVVYIQNNNHIKSISQFIIIKYETEGNEGTWESHIRELRKGTLKDFRKVIHVLGVPAIFILTSTLALTIGYLNSKNTFLEMLLTLIGFCSIILIVALYYPKLKDYR